MVGWEFAAHVAQFLGGGLARWFSKVHSSVVKRFAPFAQIAWATGRNNVLPAGHTARGTWNNVVKGKFATLSTILASEFIPQK
jgi:hypothetical protein